MFTRNCRTLSASIVTLIATTALFIAPLSVADLTQQQALFVSMEKSLKRGNNELYLQSRNQLNNYPLAPYLEYLYIANRFKDIDQKVIDRFVTKNQDLPQTTQLQFQWLGFLAKRKRWNSYLAAYKKVDIQNNRYQCLKGIALKELGRTREAWQEAEDLWLIGKSQHKACDPLFKSWTAAGQRTQALIYARFWLAAIESNTSLARYLDSKITQPNYQTTTQLFWEIHQSPQQLVTTSKLTGSNPHHRLMMLHGINRLAYKDPDGAINVWLSLKNKYPFTLKQIAKIDQRLALRVAKSFADNASEQVARIDPAFQYPEVTQWRIRLALANQNWGMVQALITQLPASEQQSSRWSYWRSVAELKFNKNHGSFSGITQYKPLNLKNNDALNRLSQERNFYAFLVASLNKQPFQLNHEAFGVRQQDLEQLMAEFKGFPRIKEWLSLEKIYSAQSELNRIFPQLSNKQRKLIPYLASQLNWHHQAIMSAAKEALWNDLDIRFPSPQSQLFSKHAELRKLDYPWVLAIARQESAFNPMARSHAGAKGLMQLMPATARESAKKHRIPYRRESELYKPEVNIALGTAHLSWLAARFEDSKIYATAAYNAGSTPVKRWLNDRGHLPLDIWIETIPYDETRRYIQNVLSFMVIYGNRDNFNHRVQMFSPREIARLTLAPSNLVAEVNGESP